MNKPRAFDPSVYFVADPSVCAGRSLVSVVKQAVAGGVTMVQLRNKSGNYNEFLEQARMLRKILNVPFIINDNVGIAMAVGADGVHLGQEDTPPPAIARQLLGLGKIIGITAFEPAHFQKIAPGIVDYAGTGPVFSTDTKPGKKILGPEGFAALERHSPVPVIGIGGITPGKAQSVIAAGAAGVAMMRAISESADPRASAAAFVRVVKGNAYDSEHLQYSGL